MLHPDASNDVLWGVFERTGEACVAVMDLPEDVRKAKRPGKDGTPESAAFLNAFMWLSAATQLIERGELPADFLDGVLD
jgi:hypothetical protein